MRLKFLKTNYGIWPKLQDIFLIDNRLRKDDFFLISFPRSGTTWAKLIGACILYPDAEIKSLSHASKLVPGVHQGIPRSQYSFPRLIKSHKNYAVRNQSSNRKLYKKIIYIIRNPYNVLKSYYSYYRASDRIHQDFLNFSRQSLNGMLFPCSWQEHVMSWHEASKQNSTLFIKYEDMQADCPGIIKQMADFLDKKVNNEKIKIINDFCSLENMRKLEANGSNKPENYDFVRPGENREIREITPEIEFSVKEMIRNKCSEPMHIFGYLI